MSGGFIGEEEIFNDLNFEEFDEKCSFCNSFGIIKEIKNTFGTVICNKCKKEKLKFITKTTARKDYLLTEEELTQFKFLTRPNPHRIARNDMCLYLEEEIKNYSISKHESVENLEKVKKERVENRRSKRIKKLKTNINKIKKRGSVNLVVRKKHVHKFIQKNNKGVCECGLEIEMETVE